MAVLLAVTLLVRQLPLTDDIRVAANGAILLGFIALSAWNAYALIRDDAYNIWMPVTLFILSSALFLGFGPLAYNFGTEGTKTYLALRRVNAGPEDLLRATTLSLAGLFGIMIGMFAIFARRTTNIVHLLKGSHPVLFPPSTMAAVFVIGGLLSKYLLIYPSRWGLLPITIPGALNEISAIAALGMGLWAYLAVRRGGVAVVFFLIVWLIDLTLTTLDFSKRELVLAMIFPLAGYYLATRNAIVAGLLSLIVIAVYSFSQPMMTYARLVGIDEYSSSGYAKRANVLLEYVIERPNVPEQGFYYGSQRWWTRFEFSAKQAYAMDLHDSGQGSDSLKNLPVVFIPRIVWPEKPVIRGPGRDFYFLVTGRDTNNMSMTVYADLYWQFGWMGIILLTPVIGAAVALMHKVLLPEVKSHNFIYFPAALIAMQTVLMAPNKYAINGVLTSIPIFVIYILVLKLLPALVTPIKPGRNILKAGNA